MNLTLGDKALVKNLRFMLTRTNNNKLLEDLKALTHTHIHRFLVFSSVRISVVVSSNGFKNISNYAAWKDFESFLYN